MRYLEAWHGEFQNDRSSLMSKITPSDLQGYISEQTRILERVPFPIAILTGANQTIAFANARFRHTFFQNSLLEKAINGPTSFLSVLPEVYRNRYKALLENVSATGQKANIDEQVFELITGTSAKSKSFLSFSCEPIFTKEITPESPDRERVECILVAVTDVTELLKTRQDSRESESYMRDIVDSSPAMIWITDEKSQCVYLSKQWYEFTGRTPEQDLGIGWLENIHPEDLKNTSDVYANAVENKGTLDVDYRLRRKDGQYRWAIDLGFPRFDKSGEFRGYIGTVTEIHERLLIEHELKSIQERFERSAEATDLGVWYCDLPFEELIWNKEVKNHFFLPPETRITIDLFYARIHPDDREPTRSAIDYSIANKSAYDIVYRTTHPADSARIKFIRAMGWTDYDQHGVPKRFDGITLDVTAHLKAQGELRQAKEAAEAANNAKTAFLANMSHEIRTPLAAILGFSDLLKDPNLDATDRSLFSATISRNGKALTRIIDDILDLAKVEAGKFETENIELNLELLLDEVSDLFQESCKAKGIFLRWNILEGTNSKIISDQARLRQIFINMIGNAVKFTPSGGVHIEVSAASEVDGRLLYKVTVQDTGVGITDEQKQRLFQPFSQADNSTTRKFGGTGLGLALSQRLARALGGDIQIESDSRQQGTRFVVTFLAQPVKENTHDVTAAEGDVVAARPELRLAGIKVLVADDAADNQLLIQRLLTKNGASVVTASNGAEAHKMALENEFTIILMDLQMPVMDGYEATRVLRKAGYTKPIIALTAHAMAEERERTRSAGCDAHLTKPLEKNSLLTTIESLCRKA